MTFLTPFGAHGLDVSPLGLGTSHTASLSTPHGLSSMGLFVEQAYEQGIRFFDTADIYGQGDAERLLARVANKEGSVICTKAGLGIGRAQPLVRLVKPVLRPLLARYGALRHKSSTVRQSSERHVLDPEMLQRRLLGSLKRLKRDQVDVFLLHSPPLEMLADGQLYDFLDQVRDRGIACMTGISVQTLEDAWPIAKAGRVSALQVPINAQTLAQAQPMLRLAAQSGIGVIAREVLSGAKDQGAALTALLADPLVPVSLVGTTSHSHLAANVSLMKKAVHAS